MCLLRQVTRKFSNRSFCRELRTKDEKKRNRYVERPDIVRQDGQSTIMQASITLKENRRKEKEKINITFYRSE